MHNKPFLLAPKPKSPLRWLLLALAIAAVVAGLLAYDYFFSSKGRWVNYRAYTQDHQTLAEYRLQPGTRCDGSPFAFPTTGVIFGLWDDSYGLRHRHQGLDIFAGTQVGATPIYAAYPGYLTRAADWISTVIIRIPSDPLQPNRQIWTYYTHMADKHGASFVSEAFPPGTSEVFVEAGTLLGFQGDYSGDPSNPTGLHLHFSIVKDDGQGSFLNELEISNTLDPSPYFNLPVNDNQNPVTYPQCAGTTTTQNWNLEPEHE
ncbi:MAG: M23 family metallopeptidase [Anaerolineae bacterium]|nr:M23 family metallopeptidase [Anaerolineae bacterium]